MKFLDLTPLKLDTEEKDTTLSSSNGCFMAYTSYIKMLIYMYATILPVKKVAVITLDYHRERITTVPG